jgi:hypothetical protein
MKKIICEEKDKNDTMIYIIGNQNDFLIDPYFNSYTVINTFGIKDINYDPIIDEIQKCDKNILLYSNNLQNYTYLIINNLIDMLLNNNNNNNKKFNNLSVLYETNDINSIVNYNRNIKKIVNIIPDLDFLRDNFPENFKNKKLFPNTNYKLYDAIYRVISARKTNGWIDWYFNIPKEAHGRIRQYDNDCCWFATAFNMIIMSDKLNKFIRNYIKDDDNKICFMDIKYSESIINLFKNQLYCRNELNTFNSNYIGYLSVACSLHCENDIDEIVDKTQSTSNGNYAIKAIDSFMRLIIGEDNFLFMSFITEEDDDKDTVMYFTNFAKEFNGKYSFDITEICLNKFIEDETHNYKIILLEFPTWEGEDYEVNAIYKAPDELLLGNQKFILCSVGLPIFDTESENSHAMAGVYNKNSSFIYESNNNPIIKCDWNNTKDICIDNLKNNDNFFNTYTFGGMDALIYINSEEL